MPTVNPQRMAISSFVAPRVRCWRISDSLAVSPNELALISALPKLACCIGKPFVAFDSEMIAVPEITVQTRTTARSSWLADSPASPESKDTETSMMCVTQAGIHHYVFRVIRSGVVRRRIWRIAVLGMRFSGDSMGNIYGVFGSTNCPQHRVFEHP